MAESCKPCEEENKKTASDGFCRECEEHMCQTCFQNHLKFRFGRDHEFLPSTSEKHKENERNVERVDQCKKHDKQLVTYYCRKHDQVGCGDCMLFDGHNECQPEHIKKLASNIQEQEDFVSMYAKLQILSCLNEANAKQLHENRQYSRELSDKLLESIGCFRVIINSYLDKAEADIETELGRIRKESDELLNKLEEDCCSTGTYIKECQQKIESTHFPENVLFINLVTIKHQLSEIEEKIKKTKKLTKIDRYRFKPDMKLNEAIDTKRSLGTFEKVVEKATTITKHTTKGQNNDRDDKDTLKPIQIFITNFRNKVKTCTVTPTETIKALKKKICDKEGIPFDQIQLYIAFTGKTLRDEFKMCDYDIHDGCTLNCRMILMNKPKE